MIDERTLREEQALDIAKKMAVAARTAPKAKGVDIIEIAVLAGEDLETVACELEVYSADTGMKFPLRDAGNVRACQAIVAIGTRSALQGLNCGHCGFPTCAEKPESCPCAINSVDVGIAIGAACAQACTYKVDTRVMFSAGMAIQRLGLLGEGVGQVYAIPVSISSKSPFFDRSQASPKG